MKTELLENLIVKNESKIIFLVIDGASGIPQKEGRRTALATGRTPNLDRLTKVSSCGLLDPIAPGITPGSGPAHLALFGYDPLKFNIGRGVLSALGIGFELKEGDVSARVNFAAVDQTGKVVDRRAGRISSEENQRICGKLKENIKLAGGQFFLETVKEHRAVLVLRGGGLDDHIRDTDPQKTGVAPLPPKALRTEAEKTVGLVSQLIDQARQILKDEPKANMLLLRGFARFRRYRSMKERVGLNCLAIANYPMYRGLARLVGMDVARPTQTLEEEILLLKENFPKYDFFFLHVKRPDSLGEDGNFRGKVKEIERVDRIIPEILALNPDVVVVTSDHSTPAKLKSHSWHPVPVILYSKYCLPDEVGRFDELSCARGVLGRIPAADLMGVVLANALRLKKYGA